MREFCLAPGCGPRPAPVVRALATPGWEWALSLPGSRGSSGLGPRPGHLHWGTTDGGLSPADPARSPDGHWLAPVGQIAAPRSPPAPKFPLARKETPGCRQRRKNAPAATDSESPQSGYDQAARLRQLRLRPPSKGHPQQPPAKAAFGVPVAAVPGPRPVAAGPSPG